MSAHYRVGPDYQCVCGYDPAKDRNQMPLFQDFLAALHAHCLRAEIADRLAAQESHND